MSADTYRFISISMMISVQVAGGLDTVTSSCSPWTQ